jgi:hypothetical protein
LKYNELKKDTLQFPLLLSAPRVSKCLKVSVNPYSLTWYNIAGVARPPSDTPMTMTRHKSLLELKKWVTKTVVSRRTLKIGSSVTSFMGAHSPARHYSSHVDLERFTPNPMIKLLSLKGGDL